MARVQASQHVRQELVTVDGCVRRLRLSVRLHCLVARRRIGAALARAKEAAGLGLGLRLPCCLLRGRR